MGIANIGTRNISVVNTGIKPVVYTYTGNPVTGQPVKPLETMRADVIIEAGSMAAEQAFTEAEISPEITSYDPVPFGDTSNKLLDLIANKFSLLLVLTLFPLFLVSCSGNKEPKAEKAKSEQISTTKNETQSTLAPDKVALNEEFNSYDSNTWMKADGWANGEPFNCGWKADHAVIENGMLTLKLDNVRSSDRSYTSGEYRTNASYNYGTIEASIKAANESGIVGGSLFTFTGTYGTSSHHEIDIEFIKGKMQCNFYTNGKGNHEHLVDLGFDPSEKFHVYKIEWAKDHISWYVDGKEVHKVTDKEAEIPNKPGQIMMNLWNGTGVSAWLGSFSYSKPIYAYYDWIKYVPEGGIAAENVLAQDNKASGTSKTAPVVTKEEASLKPGEILINNAVIAKSGGFNGARGSFYNGTLNLNTTRLTDAGIATDFNRSFDNAKLEFDYIGKCSSSGRNRTLTVVFIKTDGNPKNDRVLSQTEISPDVNQQKASLLMPAGTNKVSFLIVGEGTADVMVRNGKIIGK